MKASRNTFGPRKERNCNSSSSLKVWGLLRKKTLNWMLRKIASNFSSTISMEKITSFSYRSCTMTLCLRNANLFRNKTKFWWISKKSFLIHGIKLSMKRNLIRQKILTKKKTPKLVWWRWCKKCTKKVMTIWREQ